MRHQAILIKFPVLVPVGPKPVSSVVAPFISETDRDPISRIGPKLLYQAIIQFTLPFAREKSDDLVAASHKLCAVPPLAVEAVGQRHSARIAAIPGIFGRLDLLTGGFFAKRREGMALFAHELFFLSMFPYLNGQVCLFIDADGVVCQLSCMETISPRASGVDGVRDRVLSTATRLFYQDGIRATGIDRVIGEAKVAKASFYHHFPSKRDLVNAFLDQRHRNWMSWYAAAVENQLPTEGFAAVGTALFDWFDLPDFRGCAFINSWVEFGADFPAAFDHKQELKQFVEGVAGRLELNDPAKAAVSAMVVIEGAIVRAQMGARDGLREAVSATLRDIANSGNAQKPAAMPAR